MIIAPIGFTPTKYAGYYYHINEQRLYSIKSGILKPIKHQPPSYWNKGHGGYTISHCGKKRWLCDQYLNKLQIEDYVIPTDKL